MVMSCATSPSAFISDWSSETVRQISDDLPLSLLAPGPVPDKPPGQSAAEAVIVGEGSGQADAESAREPAHAGASK